MADPAVDHVSDAVKALQAEWAVTEPLMKGTLAMREASTALLPQWPNEAVEAYGARKKTATLFPAYRRTVSVMAGKPFSKEIVLDKTVPARLVEFAQDIDMQGTNLHAFAAGMLTEAMAHGLCGILVDAPKQPPTTSPRGPTVAEQKAQGVRPYFVRVNHSQLLGWKIRAGNGALRLVQLRILESETRDDGAFGEATVQRVRVLEPGKWEIHEKSANTGNWTVVDHGATGLMEIPFAPLYGVRLGLMQAALPLVDLAHLNVKHWQSQSDQDTILHVARVPILAMSGASTDTTLVLGASSAVMLPQGGELKFVEHTGASIDAGQKSIDALEEQMIQTGAELLVKKPGQRSATESSNDAEANKSDLQRITEAFEDSLDLAMWFMAQFIGEKTGGHVALFKDFGAGTLGEASGQLVMSMQQGGLITKVTAVREMQRRGVVSPDINPELEIESAANEGPDPGDEDDDEDEDKGGGE
jgi:hypothetical protein